MGKSTLFVVLDFLVNSTRLSSLWTSWFVELKFCELDEYRRWRDKGSPWAWLTHSLLVGFQELSPVFHACVGSIAHQLREWSQTHRERSLQELQQSEENIPLKPSDLFCQYIEHRGTFLSFLYRLFFPPPRRAQTRRPHCPSTHCRVCLVLVPQQPHLITQFRDVWHYPFPSSSLRSTVVYITLQLAGLDLTCLVSPLLSPPFYSPCLLSHSFWSPSQSPGKFMNIKLKVFIIALRQ